MIGAESGAGAEEANFDPAAHQAVVDRDSQEEVESEPGLGVERTKASPRVLEPGASQHLPVGGRPQRGVEITHHDERAGCVCHFGAEVLKELFIAPRKVFLAVGQSPVASRRMATPASSPRTKASTSSWL